MQILYDNAPIITTQGTALSGGAIKIHPRSAVSAIWGTAITIPIGDDGIPEQVTVNLSEGDYCVAYLPSTVAAGSRPTCDWIYSVTTTSPGAITPQALLDNAISARDYGRSYQELTAQFAAAQTELTRLQGVDAELTEALAIIERYELVSGGTLESSEIAAQIEEILSQGTPTNALRETADCPGCTPAQMPTVGCTIPMNSIREVDCPTPSIGCLAQAKRLPTSRKYRARALPSSPTLDIHALMSRRTPVVPERLDECSSNEQSSTTQQASTSTTTTITTSATECSLLC